MEEVLLLVVLVVGGALTIAALAIGAWTRTSRHNTELQEIERRLENALDRVRSLESSLAAIARREATPTTAAPPAAATQAAPPPVREAPVVPTPGPGPIQKHEPRTEPSAAPAGGVEPLTTDEPPAEDFGPEPTWPAAEVIPPLPPEPPNPITEWLLRGNPIAKVGIVLMFFGLAYLLKFASDRGMLPIEIRLAGAAVIATGLLVVGWRLRARNPVYGLTLQGGAIGALYLTSFAAFRVYSLLPQGLVFGLLVVICAASVTLAVLQRAQSLALLASLGGYLAPILLSTGGGNHVALFSYYAILSAGILSVSVWQAWRPLNLVGFAFTFGVGTLWGLDRYTPDLYASTQIFLALNLVIYGVLAALTALRHSGAKGDVFVDGTLVFGAPLIGFGLQAGLTRHWEYGPAFSALAFGALYLPLAWFTLRRWPDRARRITIAFLALGGGFVTLAIPLALSARFTAMAWALEGLGILWVGRMQQHLRMVASGTGLLVLAAYAAGNAWGTGLDTPTFLFMTSTLSLTWIAGARIWHTIETPGTANLSSTVSIFLLAGGVATWLLLIVDGASRAGLNDDREVMLALAAMSLTTIVWSVVASQLRWIRLGECGFVLWPFAAVALGAQMLMTGHPLGSGWWSAAWPAAFAVALFLLGWAHGAAPDSRRRPVFHATYLWLLFAVTLAESVFRLDRLGWGNDEWEAAGYLALCAAFVVPIWRLGARDHWMVASYPKAHWVWGLLPPLALGFVLLGTANLLDGRTAGWSYIPLINPLEQAAAFMLLMMVVWHRALQRLVGGEAASAAALATAAALVWWLNGVLLRSLAMIGGVTWSADGLWESTFIQTSMALAWTTAALVCMALGARRAHRPAWFIGAAALAVVVVKLFLVDSARGGGLARAVAFIGVALLVLVIGYLAPLPPRAPSRPSEGETPS